MCFGHQHWRLDIWLKVYYLLASDGSFYLFQKTIPFIVIVWNRFYDHWNSRLGGFLPYFAYHLLNELNEITRKSNKYSQQRVEQFALVVKLPLLFYLVIKRHYATFVFRFFFSRITHFLRSHKVNIFKAKRELICKTYWSILLSYETNKHRISFLTVVEYYAAWLIDIAWYYVYLYGGSVQQ